MSPGDFRLTPVFSGWPPTAWHPSLLVLPGAQSGALQWVSRGLWAHYPHSWDSHVLLTKPTTAYPKEYPEVGSGWLHEGEERPRLPSAPLMYIAVHGGGTDGWGGGALRGAVSHMERCFPSLYCRPQCCLVMCAEQGTETGKQFWVEIAVCV